ncbi:hypothetical protein BXZ70DRAFT_70673 [Cristinia sonorae]|uniref:Uncharacterized protein n=1 Tax=Cristinia sonorae TaxID=1940300 RepID=A0A8K0XQW6_9AGAR|nr:hypothetical protein BXZ70DRAFT_70673 [Cristinia sonorae]
MKWNTFIDWLVGTIAVVWIATDSITTRHRGFKTLAWFSTAIVNMSIQSVWCLARLAAYWDLTNKLSIAGLRTGLGCMRWCGALTEPHANKKREC